MALSREEGREKDHRKARKRCGYPSWDFLKSMKENNMYQMEIKQKINATAIAQCMRGLLGLVSG